MNTNPAYVDSFLCEWTQIAFESYDAYERLGRGVVGISRTDGGTELLYAGRDYFVQKGDDEMARMIDAYDPEWEFLVVFDTPQDKTRILRVRTPEGKHHPKRIWSFEMLRRVTEEPEVLPESLPAWFQEALAKLNQTRIPSDRSRPTVPLGHDDATAALRGKIQ